MDLIIPMDYFIVYSIFYPVYYIFYHIYSLIYSLYWSIYYFSIMSFIVGSGVLVSVYFIANYVYFPMINNKPIVGFRFEDDECEYVYKYIDEYDELLLKELVTREVCPENRRKIEVQITQKGLDLLNELDPRVLEHEKEFSNNLSPEEIIQLNSLLEKYRNIK